MMSVLVLIIIVSRIGLSVIMLSAVIHSVVCESVILLSMVGAIILSGIALNVFMCRFDEWWYVMHNVTLECLILLSVSTTSATMQCHYVKCHAECRWAKCCGAIGMDPEILLRYIENLLSA